MQTATDIERPVIAYAMPIGGGWAHFCADCFDAHRAEADPDALAECEPILEFSAGTTPHCEICGEPIAHGWMREAIAAAEEA